MSDEIIIDSTTFVSSKRAAELSRYAQDYIGQLARGGFIDARRIGGLWYVSMASLEEYKRNAAILRPQPIRPTLSHEPDSFISFDGKEYVSASRASEITSYNQDYVGQLARSGTILARQVGNRWYVDRAALVAHKDEKDNLLAAVQVQSVGINPKASSRSTNSHVNSQEELALYTYTRDSRGLLPSYATLDDKKEDRTFEEEFKDELEDFRPVEIPIRVFSSPKILNHDANIQKDYVLRDKIDTSNIGHVKSAVRMPRKAIFYGTLSATTLTIVIVLSLGMHTFGNQYPDEGGIALSLVASASAGIGTFADFLEGVLTRDLTYQRSN